MAFSSKWPDTKIRDRKRVRTPLFVVFMASKRTIAMVPFLGHDAKQILRGSNVPGPPWLSNRSIARLKFFSLFAKATAIRTNPCQPDVKPSRIMALVDTLKTSGLEVKSQAGKPKPTLQVPSSKGKLTTPELPRPE